MKLAEALQERADLNRKIRTLCERLNRVILVQEGVEPVENPDGLLKELDASIDRLTYLIAAINHTNDRITVNGMTLTQLIARKDAANVRMNAYKGFIREAGQNTYRARGTEIKVIPTIRTADLQREADRMAKEIRLLDNMLQETNWTNDLLE